MRGHWRFTASLLALCPAGAMAQNVPSGDSPDAATAAAQTDGVPDIVVTARKQAERLSEVPAAVSALSGDTLADLGTRNVADFAALVPGLTFQNSGPGANTLALRGINTGNEPSPLVGVVLDGVPYGSSSSFAFGGLISLDSALWDAERVEVLRGPQGTLYGASAMGGLLSYVYRQPSLDRVDVEAEGEVSTTEHGGYNYVARLAAGAPIVTDKVGLRIAASRQYNDGFLNNSLLGRNYVNRQSSDNVRGSLLFKPDDRLSVTLSGFYQKTRGDSNDSVIYSVVTGRPIAGELDQRRARSEPSSTEAYQGALNINYDFGAATLTSITAYQHVQLDSDIDFSGSPLGFGLTNPGVFISPALAGIPGTATTGIAIDAGTRKITEELRLASPTDRPFQVLLGFFFDDERSHSLQFINGDFANGQRNPFFDPAISFTLPSRYREYAGFGQVTYAFTPQFDVTGGIRYSRDEQQFSQINGGILGGGVTIPDTRSNEDQVTYLGTLRYRPSRDHTLYARVASGYRPGGPNVVRTGLALPTTFKSDRLTNYEVGYKGRFLGGRADVQIDGFYIDWKDIQVVAAAGGFTGRANGGAARSKGVELSGTLRPVQPLTLGYSFAYIDAYLKDAVPALGARAGERLPNTAKASGSVFAEVREPLSDGWNGVAGATFRAMGRRTTSYDASPSTPQFDLRPYGIVDLRLGVENDAVSVTGFVRNVGDKRAEYSAITSRLTVLGQAAVTIAQPRTYGVTVGAKF